MLDTALKGLDVVRNACASAIEQAYRFNSYSDGSLLSPRRGQTCTMLLELRC